MHLQLPFITRKHILLYVVVAMLLVVVGPIVTTGPITTTLLPPRSYGKPEAAAAVDRLLMMGKRIPETCLTVLKRQAINL